MKKLFFTITFLLCLTVTSCYDSDIESINNRLDAIENTQIASLKEQIKSINNTLPELENADKELKEYITKLQSTATELKEEILAVEKEMKIANEELDKAFKDALEEAIKNAEVSNDSLKADLIEELKKSQADIMAQLEATKSDLNNELAQINAAIETLQAKDKALENKISELKEYVNGEIQNTKDWATATFATLKQYNTLAEEVATIKENINSINNSITALEEKLTESINSEIAKALETVDGNIKEVVEGITAAYTKLVADTKKEITEAYTQDIADAISSIEVSMKSWVNEQLAGYYTIAQVEAKLSILSDACATKESLQQEVENMSKSLRETKNEIIEAYTKAITDAISTNNGLIDGKIAEAVSNVNSNIDNKVATINAKISVIEERLNRIEDEIASINKQIATLIERIQSISFVPEYSDGKVKIDYRSHSATLDFIVSPSSLATTIKTVFEADNNNIKAFLRYTQTRSTTAVENLNVENMVVGDNGLFTLTIKEQNLSKEFWNGEIEGVIYIQICDNNGNDVVSDCIPVFAEEFPYSVSVDKKVILAKGNLQYHPKNNVWHFADNQYDYIGDSNCNISSNYDGWIDLYGWSSTGRASFGISSSTEYYDYQGNFVDWGKNKIDNYEANIWRTMAKEEWEYLLENRTNAINLKGCAQINGINGLIILPDNWISPDNISFNPGFHNSNGEEFYPQHQSFTIKEWQKLEKRGAIFLPASGSRQGTSMAWQGSGLYWTSTIRSDRTERAYELIFDSSQVSVGNMAVRDGYAVRLVQDF